jgi:hypothetical protein
VLAFHLTSSQMSETMAHFHDYFKYEFNNIYQVRFLYTSSGTYLTIPQLADGSFTKRGLSLATFMREAQGLESRQSCLLPRNLTQS